MKQFFQTRSGKLISLSIFVVFMLILVVIYQQSYSNIQNPPQTLEEILAENPPFLSKDQGSYKEHYTGNSESSNYTIYGEKDGKLAYTILSNPSDFEFPSLDDYFTKYQTPDLELYGPWSERSGSKSYVYLRPGLIVIGHPVSKTIVEEWHIKPNLSVDDFKAAFSDKFSPSPPIPSNNF